MKITVRQITITAMLLALCITAQQFKNLSQFITGPIVNAILIIAVLLVGLWSGLAIALLSPVAALLISPSPILLAVPPMTAIIALGNMTLVFVIWLLSKSKMLQGKALLQLPIILVAAALCKAGVLFAGVKYLALPVFGGGLKPPQIAGITTMFLSYNQMITALLGGTLAYLLYIPLKKALKK